MYLILHITKLFIILIYLEMLCIVVLTAMRWHSYYIHK